LTTPRNPHDTLRKARVAAETSGSEASGSEASGRPDRAGRTRHLLPPSDGARYRQLSLTLDSGGGLTLTFHEMGASLEAAWGADDNEVSVALDRDALARLALALIAERLDGRSDGLERLQALCQRHAVDYKLACWT